MSVRTHFTWADLNGTCWAIEKLVGPANWTSWLSDLRSMLGPEAFEELDPTVFKFSFEQHALLQRSPERDKVLNTLYLVVGVPEYQWIVLRALTPYHAMRGLLHLVEDEYALMHGGQRCGCPACGSPARSTSRRRVAEDHLTLKVAGQPMGVYQSSLVRKQSVRSLPRTISEEPTDPDSTMSASPMEYW